MTIEPGQLDEGAIARMVDEVLEVHDPGEMPPEAFLGARFDAGLAWRDFALGHGGLGASRRWQSFVERRFLLDLRAPGVRVEPLRRQMTGDAESDEVWLDDVRVGCGAARSTPCSTPTAPSRWTTERSAAGWSGPGSAPRCCGSDSPQRSLLRCSACLRSPAPTGIFPGPTCPDPDWAPDRRRTTTSRSRPMSVPARDAAEPEVRR